MPAAAVIPAPIAYIKVVAVKKLVVEFLRGPLAPLRCELEGRASLGGWPVLYCAGLSAILYCEKIRVFKAGLWLEYISME